VTQILKKGEPGGGSGEKVITREVIAASAEATHILEDAKRRAEAIVAGADAARAEAMEAGRRQGFEHGAAQWAAAIKGARESVRAAMEEAKPQIVRMALRVAEKILRQKLEIRPDALVPMVDEALRSLQGQHPTRIVLRVHPADRGVLEQRRAHWLDRNPGIASINVVADEAFPRGGCRIESDFGMVDATLETQLRVIERHLLGEGGGTP
jgi:type III secretion system HrpE/YscL family protein